MKPVGKYIVIKTIEEEIKTSSGLLLSATDVDEFRYRKGSVIKPGTDVSVVKPEDIIYNNNGSNVNVKLFKTMGGLVIIIIK